MQVCSCPGSQWWRRVSQRLQPLEQSGGSALLGAFVHSNPGAFHRADHAGYRFLGEQVASRLITPLTRWRRYEPAYADGMRAVLKELLEHPGLSRDSFEVVSRSLA